MKINVKAHSKITEAIRNAEGSRVTVRTAREGHVSEAVKRIETRLSGLLLKKDWTGLVFDIDPNAQVFPSAYNGIPESTHIRIERFPSGWFVTKIWRGRCGVRRTTAINLHSKATEIAAYVCENF